jgi:hypothetical protein
MKKVFMAAVAAAAMMAQAHAVSVRDCDPGIDSVSSIPEPWADNTRKFYNDSVRLTVLDIGEPACCSMHLMVTFPTGGTDGPEEMQCKFINESATLGLPTIDLKNAKSQYDAKTGLTITVPYGNDVNGVKEKAGVVKLRIDMKKGEVSLLK